MDARRFDALAKTLSVPGTRRHIARLLAGLPLGVTLASILGNGPGAAAQDDDHGSSHRRHRRKTRNARQSGDDKENRTGKRKGKGKGRRKDRDTGGPECPAGSTACCAAGRCREGACVANYVTLAECQGRCDCPVSDCTPIGPYAITNACGPDLVSCPSCGCDPEPCTNSCAGYGCDVLVRFLEGPAGYGVYCTSGASGTCSPSGSGCSAGQACGEGDRSCLNICTGR